MVRIEDLWAIIWPVLKEVLSQIEPEYFLLLIVAYLATMAVVRSVLRSLLHVNGSGRLLSEILGFFIDLVAFVLPIWVPYSMLRSTFPILTQLVSYLVDFSTWEETLVVWGKILLVCGVAFGVSRWLLHLVSVILQRVFNSIDALLVRLTLINTVRVVEGVGFFLTVMWVPLLALSLLRVGEGFPVSLSDPLVEPEGVDAQVWAYIGEGVERAQANGVACDPYILYSLKVYETGANICTEADASSPRPNQCASGAGALGMFQFMPETFERNASRYGVTGSLWSPSVAAEVACYFISDEANLSLNQSRAEFAEEFSSKGFIWNADPSGAGTVYDRAIVLRQSARDSMDSYTPPQEYVSSGYIWPAPAGSYVTFEWGVPMWYGSNHNGIDVALPGFVPFAVVALDSGSVRYWDGGSCNAGVITLQTSNGEQFHYVHMELDPGKINIPTDGSWTPIKKGEELGWILDGTTSCSDGSHLHLMRVDGSYLSKSEIK